MPGPTGKKGRPRGPATGEGGQGQPACVPAQCSTPRVRDHLSRPPRGWGCTCMSSGADSPPLAPRARIGGQSVAFAHAVPPTWSALHPRLHHSDISPGSLPCHLVQAQCLATLLGAGGTAVQRASPARRLRARQGQGDAGASPAVPGPARSLHVAGMLLTD